MRRIETLRTQRDDRQPHARQGHQEQGRAPLQGGGVRTSSTARASARWGEIIDLGAKLDLIEKAGAWYTVGDARIQGRDGVRTYLEEHPDVMDKLGSGHPRQRPQAADAAGPPGRRGRRPRGGHLRRGLRRVSPAAARSAKEAAMRLLERRDYGRDELAAKLVEKGFEASEGRGGRRPLRGSGLCKRRKLRRHGGPALHGPRLRREARARGAAPPARAPRILGRGPSPPSRTMRTAPTAACARRCAAARRSRRSCAARWPPCSAAASAIRRCGRPPSATGANISPRRKHESIAHIPRLPQKPGRRRADARRARRGGARDNARPGGGRGRG